MVTPPPSALTHSLSHATGVDTARSASDRGGRSRAIGGGEGAAPYGPACLIPGSRRRLKRPLVQIAQTSVVANSCSAGAFDEKRAKRSKGNGESCKAKAPV